MSVKLCPHCGRDVNTPAVDEHGRSPKFDDPEVRKKILDAVAKGNTLVDAAMHAGVDEKTVRVWLQKGLEQRRKRLVGKRRQFLDEYERAESKLRYELVERLHTAAEKNPWLLIAMLERVDPARWNRTEAAVVREDRDRLLSIIKSEFADEPEIVARFLGAVAGLVGARALQVARRGTLSERGAVKTLPPGGGSGT